MWPDRRLLELFNIELPIVQARVAGAMDWELAAAAAEAGAPPSAPCAVAKFKQGPGAKGENPAPPKQTQKLKFFLPSPPGAKNPPPGPRAGTLAAPFPAPAD